MATQDITGMLTGIFPEDNTAQQQALLGRKAVAQNPKLLASTQMQIGQSAQNLDRMRRGASGLFGTDFSTPADRVKQQLVDLDVKTPEGQQQAVKLISQIDPVKALVLQDQFNERNKAELKAAAEFGLKKDKLDYQRESLATTRDQLGVSDRKAIREATANARANSDRARQLISVAEDYERFEPTGGVLGFGKDKWAEFTGTQGGEQIAKANFDSLKASVIADNLPPGAASDKDVALALKGYPNTSYNAEQLSSFLRGQAKLAAILAEREDARAEYMMTKDGLDVGFSNKWSESLQEKGFDEKIAKKYGLTWTPIETVDASTLQGVPDVNEPTQREIELGNKIIAAQSRQGSRR